VARSNEIHTRSIVRADVVEPPPSLRDAGPHWCVVLNPQSEIDAGMDLRVAVITTNTGRPPLPSGWFEMPHAPESGGHPITGLTEACVVKATWLQVIPQSSVLKLGKECRRREFNLLQNWLAEKERSMLRAKAEQRPRP
jgi:hypothetical protein